MQYLEEALAHRGIVFSGVMLLTILSTYGILPSLIASMAIAFLIIGRFQKDYVYLTAIALSALVVGMSRGVFDSGCSLQFIYFIIVSYLSRYYSQWVYCVQAVSIFSSALLYMVLQLDTATVLHFMQGYKLVFSLHIIVLVLVMELEVFSLFFVHIVAQVVDHMRQTSKGIRKRTCSEVIDISYSVLSVSTLLVYYFTGFSVGMASPLVLPYLYVGYAYVGDFFLYIVPASWSVMQKNCLYYFVMVMLVTQEVLFLGAIIVCALVGILKSYGNHWMWIIAFVKKSSGDHRVNLSK